MMPQTRPTSSLRLLSTRTIRIALLFGLIATAATVLSVPSLASSIGQRIFAGAAAIVGRSATANARANHSSSTEFVAPVESASMASERQGHTATRLADGRVLIAGGENTSGTLNQTEIYDPASATFSASGNMTTARVDHSATLLADGRVLIAGGQNVGSALATTEIFDPASGSFTSGPTMSVARAGHSATLLANGRVLVAGGDANGTAEIFDIAAGTSTATGNLGVARSQHSAALLQDGRVLVVGGKDANGNALSTGEIFDTPAGSFSMIDGALKVGRVHAHLRVLFDGKVQIIGGSNDGSMEIYDPMSSALGAYAHVLPEGDTCAGLPGQIQSSQTRAALFHNGQSDPTFDRSSHSINELSGSAIVIGGVNSSGDVLSSTPIFNSTDAAISTDRLDYSPGETAHISGRGFQPGEVVRLKIHEDPHTPQERGFDATADADGNFSGDYLVMDYDLNMKFLVGARGLTSGRTAQTTFTDARNLNLTFAGTGSGTVTITPSTGTVNAPVSCGGSGSAQASQTVSATCLPNITTSDNGATVTFNAAANVGSTFGGWSAPANLSSSTCTGTANPCSAVLGSNPALTVTFNGGTINTTTTVANQSATFGDTTVTLNATVTPASGPAINSGSVTFTVKQGATTIGVATTDNIVVAGAASVSYALPAGTSAGPYTIQAAYTPGVGFNASSGTGSLTINKRNTLTTVSSSVNPSTFGESVSFTATVVGTGAGAGNPTGGSVQFKIDGANFGAPVALAGGSATSGSTSSLSVGNHTVEAVFTSSDANFNNSNDLLDGGQTVNKRNTLTTVSSSLNPSTFGESVSFTATVVGTGAGAGNPTGGSVQFKIDGANFGAAVALTAGSASSGSISTLTAGNHTVEAIFTSSDTNFNDSNDLLDGGQTVNKRNTLTTVSSSLNPSTFGESVSFTATVVGTGAGAGNPSGGSVQFKIDGANFGAPVALVAGSASSGSISSLTAGNHTVEAIFTSSDTNFNDSNDLLDGGQTVNKRNTLTTVSSSLNPSTFGESVSFTATVVGTGAGAGNPSGGSVQFKVDGANFGAPVALVAGSASSGSISSLTAGNHTVEAIFTSSDTNFNDSNDLLDGGQTVNKRNTLTTVSSSLNPSTFGESVSFTATVVGTGAGAGNPSGGSVQFKIDGANFGAPVALVAGSASSGSISSLTAGNHTVEAIFTSSDTNFNDSNDLLDGGQTVNKRNTLTTVSSSLNPSTFGESVSFTATVVGTGAGAGNPSGGSVQFKIDGANFGAPVALVAGSASSGSISTLTAGNHTVEAIFTSSDTNFNDSNDLLDGGQVVNKRNTLTTVSSSLNPSTFGESVSFTATVVGTGAGAGNPSGGSVQFKIDGANFGAPVALTAGSASSGSISTLTAGNHTVEAIFTSSDTNFNDSNDLLDGGQTVNKRNTLTTVSSSLNPSTFGESVSFTATVVGTGAGAGNPSGGSVQFKIDGANFGAPVALTAGSASSGSISSLTAGNHTVEAIFTSSDTNFNDSNDLLDGGQTVNKRNTLTTVSSSLNPSTFGESVSFTATVVGTGAGAGNPSGGSVQFKIDGLDFGAPVALVAGSASSGSISTLSAGNHTVEAVFTSADTNFNDSNDLLDGGQVVNKRNTLTTVSSSLNPSTFGESVSFTATVVGTGAGAGNPSGGSVQFKIDGLDFGAPVALVAGSASSGSISTLSAGNHTVEAVFTSADTNFNDSNDLLDGGQQVNKRNTLTTVSSSLNPSTFGESVSFTATVVGTGAGAGNPSGGSVQFKIDGLDFGAPVALVAGSASSGSISTLSAGNHTVEAVFTSADTNFNDSNDLLDGGQQVNKRNTLTTVSSSLNPSTFGESVSFTATVVGTGAGAGNPSGGSIQFKIDGADFGLPVALAGGSASSGSTSSLSAGNHTVEAVFTSADANFNNSNDLLDGGQQVNKRNTLTTVSSSLNPSTFGESVSFTATVVGTGAGAGDPSGGSVQFKIDGANFGAPVALSGGSASSGSISSLTAGNHTVEAIFTSADANFNDSNDLLDGGQQVNKRNTLTTVSSTLNPSTFGQSVSFTATVTGTGAGAGNPSGGSIQFKIDGANFGAPVALTAGSASSGSTSTLTAGTHTVEAVFTSADANFNDSNDLLDGGQVVNKRNTLTTISSSLNPSVYGQNVTFTATVAGTGAGAGNPSGGSVQFKVDGVNVGSPVTLTAGSASSGAINNINAGTHTVEAVFTSADTNFNNSSDLLDGGQTVNKAPLTITASSHTVTFGDAVPTITASYSGFVLGQGAANLTTQPTCSTTYTVGSLVGTYPTKCENAVSSNYSFTYVNGTVTVLTACSVFNGFLEPIGGSVELGTGGSFLNPVRSFKLNSTIPVKFSAICLGVPLTTGIHTLQAIKYSDATTYDPAIDATPTDAATSGNQFRLTDGQWHFNLSTKGLGNNGQGIWLLRATLFDGSTHTVWVSIKK